MREQKSRTSASMRFTARGVKTRDRRARWKVWNGGSSKMNRPGGIAACSMITSSTAPLPEMKVSRSTSMRSTSSKRLTAKNPCSSLW